jgi:quinol monooxygenase YgiN
LFPADYDGGLIGMVMSKLHTCFIPGKMVKKTGQGRDALNNESGCDFLFSSLKFIIRRCNMIYVIATVEVTEGTRDLYLEELKKNVPLVCAENGCLQYGPAGDVATGIPIQEPINKNAVTIIEQWTDVAALKGHSTAPHMKTYREAVKNYVKKASIRVLEPI